MVHQHISHYGLEHIKTTDSHIILGSANLGYVKRIAFAHGFETVEKQYHLLGGDLPVYPVYGEKVTCYYMENHTAHTAQVRKWTPSIWSVMIPLEVWNSER